MSEGSDPERLAQHVAECDVPPHHVLAWWLGGSGFIFKTPAGTQVYVDPYLTDAANAIFGLARAFPAPLRPQDARPDVVVSTHWHEDHLDPQAIPLIARHSPSTRFVMPPSAMARALSWGVPRDRINPLTTDHAVSVADVKMSHVPARHEAGIAGWEVPDAMGIIVETEGLKIYHSGDTEYDARLRALKALNLDAMMVCINGVGGNMNAHEAALLCWHLGAKTVIPMHHYLWAGQPGDDEATLDPQAFTDTYRRLGGAGRIITPTLGEGIDIGGSYAC